MTQDLIKTPVTVVEEMNVWRMLDADGETVTVTGNADPTQINRLAHTLNVLSGKLSGDPNGTATKEERELWRYTAIVWADKVEMAAQALIDCHELFDVWEDGSPRYIYASGRKRDLALQALINLLKIGKK